MNKKIILPRLDIEILNLKSKALSNRIQRYIDSHKKVICKWLNRRPIFIDEYLFFTESRKSSDKNHRKQSFFAWIDLIKKVTKEDLTNKREQWGKMNYEFKWLTPRGNLVSVHIVEFSNGKDKKLKLMSTFWKENKKT